MRDLRILIAVFLLAVATMQARAEDIGSMKRDPAPAAVTADGDLVVDVSLCRTLVSHTPRDDVNYHPGQDVVNGKVVPPADVSDNGDLNFLKTQTIEIPLTVDVARRLNISHPGVEMETRLPPLQLRPDGRVFWQGRDLTTQTVDLCEGYVPPSVNSVSENGVNTSLRPAPVSVQSPAKPVAPTVSTPTVQTPTVQTPVVQKPATDSADLAGESGDTIVQ